MSRKKEVLVLDGNNNKGNKVHENGHVNGKSENKKTQSIHDLHDLNIDALVVTNNFSNRTASPLNGFKFFAV